jgi:hypothetical protein
MSQTKSEETANPGCGQEQRQQPKAGQNGLPAISVDLIASARRSDSFPKDWTEARIQAGFQNYQRFLLLAARNLGVALAPTKDIDEFWHLHMLHPRAYAEDCKRLFGQLLDHDGGFGTDLNELPALKDTFNETARLWQAAFGFEYGLAVQTDDPGAAGICYDPNGSRALHRCKGGDLVQANQALHRCRGGDLVHPSDGAGPAALHRCRGGD